MKMGENYYGFCYWIVVRLEKHDVVWVIVDRLTKSAHFLSIQSDSLDELASYMYLEL